MDVAWFVDSVVSLALGGAHWLGRQDWATLGMLALLVGALVLVWAVRRAFRRRRRSARTGRETQFESLQRETRQLKEQLRLRLAEPAELFAEAREGAPTVGASQAFEADLEAAARTIVVEAGGSRAKAKELLRTRATNGSGTVNGKLNGSEATYWRQVGALSLLDNTGEALAAYARAAELAPDDADAQMLLGVLHMRTGHLSAAEVAFRRQIGLSNGAAGGPLCYRGRTMLGDVLAAKGEIEAALAAYTEAQHEVAALLEKDADNAGLQRDLSVTHDRIGDALMARRDLDGALESYRRSLSVAEALGKRDPAHAGWQRDLSVSHERIGEILDAKGDLGGALTSYRQGLAIAEGLAQRDTDCSEWQWDLSASLDRIGDLLMANVDVEGALKSYRRGLPIAEALAERDPANLSWQRDLAVSYHKIGSIEAARGNHTEARDLLERGRAIIARLVRIASYRAQWRSDLSKFEDALRSLQ